MSEDTCQLNIHGLFFQVRQCLGQVVVAKVKDYSLLQTSLFLCRLRDQLFYHFRFLTCTILHKSFNLW